MPHRPVSSLRASQGQRDPSVEGRQKTALGPPTNQQGGHRSESNTSPETRAPSGGSAMSEGCTGECLGHIRDLTGGTDAERCTGECLGHIRDLTDGTDAERLVETNDHEITDEWVM
jgi:hypothetical protein